MIITAAIAKALGASAVPLGVIVATAGIFLGAGGATDEEGGGSPPTTINAPDGDMTAGGSPAPGNALLGEFHDLDANLKVILRKNAEGFKEAVDAVTAYVQTTSAFDGTAGQLDEDALEENESAILQEMLADVKKFYYGYTAHLMIQYEILTSNLRTAEGEEETAQIRVAHEKSDKLMDMMATEAAKLINFDSYDHFQLGDLSERTTNVSTALASAMTILDRFSQEQEAVLAKYPLNADKDEKMLAEMAALAVELRAEMQLVLKDCDAALTGLETLIGKTLPIHLEQSVKDSTANPFFNLVDDLMLQRTGLQEKLKALNVEVEEVKQRHSFASLAADSKDWPNNQRRAMILYELTSSDLTDAIGWNSDGTEVVISGDDDKQTELALILHRFGISTNNAWVTFAASKGMFCAQGFEILDAPKKNSGRPWRLHHPYFQHDHPEKVRMMRRLFQEKTISIGLAFVPDKLARPECGQCQFVENGCQCPNRCAVHTGGSSAKKGEKAAYYSYCPHHLEHDEMLQAELISPEQIKASERKLEGLAAEGAKWKASYNADRIDIQPVSIEEMFENKAFDKYFREAWGQTQLRTTVEKDIEPFSDELKLSAFSRATDRVIGYENCEVTRRLMVHMAKVCHDCGDLFPSWKIVEDEEGTRSLCADGDFVDVDRFFGAHFDHFQDRDLNEVDLASAKGAVLRGVLEYVKPSKLGPAQTPEEAKGQFLCTEPTCCG
ncbi:hypothetical protein ACHAXT_008171 [Thalassiosira profunda]